MEVKIGKIPRQTDSAEHKSADITRSNHYIAQDLELSNHLFIQVMKPILTGAAMSVASILIGMMVITFVAESIEFAIVTMVNGSILTDEEAYFAIRNQSGILVAKLFYNGLAAFIGGYVAAWIAGKSERAHGIALAVLQLVGLIYGMTDPQISLTTPDWMWIAMIVTLMPLIVFGAIFRSRKRDLSSAK